MGIQQVKELRVALQHLSSCPDTDTLLKTLLLEARHLIGGEIGLVWLVTGTNQLRLQHTIGITSRLPSCLQQLMLPVGEERAVIRRLRYLGHRSVLTGSLHLHGHLAGIVANCSQRRRRLQRADREIFKLLNQLAGLLMATYEGRALHEHRPGERSPDDMSDLGARHNMLHVLSPLCSGTVQYLQEGLAVVGGHLEFLLNQYHEPPRDQYLNVALHGVHQAGNVLHDLRDLLSIPTGDRHGPFDLNQIVHDCVQVARSSWLVEKTTQRCPIRLLVDLHPVPPLMGSPLDLKIALLLLLRHLVNTVEPSPALVLRTWTTIQHGGQEVVLELADEPGGVHISKQEGGLEPASTYRPLEQLEVIPCFIEDTFHRLGGRVLRPRQTNECVTLLIAFTLP